MKSSKLQKHNDQQGDNPIMPTFSIEKVIQKKSKMKNKRSQSLVNSGKNTPPRQQSNTVSLPKNAESSSTQLAPTHDKTQDQPSSNPSNISDVKNPPSVDSIHLKHDKQTADKKIQKRSRKRRKKNKPPKDINNQHQSSSNQSNSSESKHPSSTDTNSSELDQKATNKPKGKKMRPKKIKTKEMKKQIKLKAAEEQEKKLLHVQPIIDIKHLNNTNQTIEALKAGGRKELKEKRKKEFQQQREAKRKLKLKAIEEEKLKKELDSKHEKSDKDLIDKNENGDVDDLKDKENEDDCNEENTDLSIEDRVKRTLFVGNVSLDAKTKDIRQLFSKYANVESVRIRSVIPENPNIPKKVALLAKRMSKFVDSLTAYVVFEEGPDLADAIILAEKECHLAEFKGKHIRVMPANVKRSGKLRCSAFLGNLPYDCSEEEVITTFLSIAKQLDTNLLNVRINRDEDTGACRGVGYVSFGDSTSVQALINMAGTVKIRGRVLRISRASKDENKLSKTYKRTERQKEFKRKASEEKKQDFRRRMAEKLEERKSIGKKKESLNSQQQQQDSMAKMIRTDKTPHFDFKRKRQ